MKGTLTRHGSIPGMGTFGTLAIGGREFRTVEPEWKNNKPFVSCIPSGIYTMEAHDSDAHPGVWAFVNHSLGVYHYDDPNAVRYACLIHVANIARELKGCCAPGSSYGFPYGEWGVINSDASIQELREIMGGKEVQIEIVWECHEDRVSGMSVL